MQFLQRAIDLAYAHGYLSSKDSPASVPAWFRALGTKKGIADFEAKHHIQLPKALQEFYLYTPLAYFLDKVVKCEVFLENYSPSNSDELPPIVYWLGVPHVVFSFHCHSGMVYAAELGTEDPLCFCGFEDEAQPYKDPKRPPQTFSEWIFTAYDIYEIRLNK